MDDIWQQFHRLPKPIRDAVATPSALAAIDRLERQHPKLDLASFVMRAMVKEFPISGLPAKLTSETELDESTAKAVMAELQTDVFGNVADYLGLSAEPVPARPTVPTAPHPIKPPMAAPSPIKPAVTVPPKPITPPATPAQPPVTQSSMAEVTHLVPAVPAPLPSRVGNIAPTQNYSQEDDQEIAAQTRKVKGIAAPDTINIDELAEQIMRQHNLAFHEELLQKRAQSLLKARLKAIRDSDDTRAMLVRAPKVGGLGLDPDMANAVIASLDLAAANLKSRGAVQPPVPIPPPPPPVIPKVEPQRPAPRPPLSRNFPPANLPVADSTVSFSPPASPGLAIKRPADIPAPEPVRPTTAPPPSRPVVRRERQPERPAMADIRRPASTIIGPAGEMSTLTLMEFRRLGQGANDTTQRLFEKFQHYQKDSFALWAQALAGWRQSEVYRIYIDMGRQSLDQGIPIREVEKQRAASGLGYLSEHEFTAIADLNRRLQP